MSKRLLPHCLLAMLVIVPIAASAADRDVYPLAIFSFQQRGGGGNELGEQVTVLLSANLLENPDLYLVEREDLNKILDEQKLNVSGLVNPDSATKVGQLTGAKILVSGSVLEVNDKLYLVAKVIGTETSRVLGASVKGNVGDDLDKLVFELSKRVGRTVVDRADDLVAHPVARVDRIAALKKAVRGNQLPKIFIEVSERHVGQATIDPAAQTELTLYCREAGFEVIDADEGDKDDGDFLLVGEGLSEFAARHGDLVSVKARLEVKAIDQKSGEVTAIDREVAIGVDLSEQMAGKSALQNAAANIASRLLPRLADSKKPRKPKRK